MLHSCSGVVMVAPALVRMRARRKSKQVVVVVSLLLKYAQKLNVEFVIVDGIVTVCQIWSLQLLYPHRNALCVPVCGRVVSMIWKPPEDDCDHGEVPLSNPPFTISCDDPP